jgi:glycosyltransferase involved in cell wall biosynthesis
LAQDFTNAEIIVTDDTPNDTVKDFIASKYFVSNLKYFKNTVSLGTPENWNEAVRKASGEYIKILHHDDYFTQKDSLSKFVALLDKNSDANLAFSATEVWNVPTGRRYVHGCSESQLERIQRDPSFLFFRNMIGAPSAVIYRRKAMVEYDKELKWLVDIDFYIRMLAQGSSVARSSEPLVCTADNTTGQVTQSVLKDEALIIKEHILVLKKIGISDAEKMTLFFDELFTRYGINLMESLNRIYPVPGDYEKFFKGVFAQMGKRGIYKKWRNWFYDSRINNQVFKLEKY